jgi:hypothetical protein
LGGDSSAVPPPVVAVGSSLPAPTFGKPQVDVAPPPFLVRKKEKKVRRIVEEVYEDAEPVVDRFAAARRKQMAIISLALALPMLVGMFWVGKSRQNWALMDRSQKNATKLLGTLTKAGPVLEVVQAKTAAALAKAKANELDTGYLDFTLEMAETRPITNSDLDMLNYAAFDSKTVDQAYLFLRTIEELWGNMTSHRNRSKNDLNALAKAKQMPVPPTQPLLGMVLTKLDEETLGGNLGLLSNPGNDEGQETMDLQVRAGRRPGQYKVYDQGSFGEKVNRWVIPLHPRETAKGTPLANGVDSHMVLYRKRLEELNNLSQRASKLQGELVNQLQGISG